MSTARNNQTNPSADQLARIKRWQRRAIACAAGEGLNAGDDRYLSDCLITAFENLLALKDWLKVQNPRIQQKVENLFFRTKPGPTSPLGFAHSMGNAYKHLKLDDINLCKSISLMRGYEPESPNNERWFIVGDGEKHDALDLLASAICDAETFMAENGFLHSPSELAGTWPT